MRNVRASIRRVSPPSWTHRHCPPLADCIEAPSRGRDSPLSVPWPFYDTHAEGSVVAGACAWNPRAQACVCAAFVNALGASQDAPASPVLVPAARVVPKNDAAASDIVTAADAQQRQAQCTGVVNASTCDAQAGCEFWNGTCGIDCQRLAAEGACTASAACDWDLAGRHCSWKGPDCATITSEVHCITTKLCSYNSSAAKCQTAQLECSGYGDAKTCARSTAPVCAWNSEFGTCADVKPCENITLPVDCTAHKGCAYSQSTEVCVNVSVAAETKPICASSTDCTEARTFCNMDFGTKGYCQNCLTLETRGVAVCEDTGVVAKPAAKSCKSACFGK